MNRKRILWITHTAIFIALLVSAQAVTRPLGQIVTGSCVNFILIASTILGGLSSATIVALISPIFAYLIIATPPFPQLIPFIMLGNLVLVFTFGIISGDSFESLNLKGYIRVCAAAISASVFKFLVLWIGVVQIALSLIPDIKPGQVENMTVVFSWAQLVTALIGSGLAIIVMPAVARALRHMEH